MKTPSANPHDRAMTGNYRTDPRAAAEGCLTNHLQNRVGKRRQLPGFGFRPMHRRLAYIVLVISGLAPFMISAKLGMTDPFTHGFVSASITLIRQGHVDLQGSPIEFVPASSFLVAELAIFTGLSPSIIEYLPIAGPLGFVSAYLLGDRLFHNRILALLLANVASYRFFGFWLYSIWPHAIGHAFFLLFLAVLLTAPARNPSKLLTLWIIFAAVTVYSYTVEFWIIILLGFLLVLTSMRTLFSARDPGRSPAPFSASIVAASVVTFLGLNQVVYGGYIPKLATAQSSFATGVDYFVATILKSSPPVPFAFVPPPSPWYLTALQVSWFLLVFGSMGL